MELQKDRLYDEQERNKVFAAKLWGKSLTKHLCNTKDEEQRADKDHKNL